MPLVIRQKITVSRLYSFSIFFCFGFWAGRSSAKRQISHYVWNWLRTDESIFLLFFFGRLFLSFSAISFPMDTAGDGRRWERQRSYGRQRRGWGQTDSHLVGVGHAHDAVHPARRRIRQTCSRYVLVQGFFLVPWDLFRFQFCIILIRTFR